MSTEHAWFPLDGTWARCATCGQERATLEGTVTLDTPGDPTRGLGVHSLDTPNGLSTLLAPFLERRVRITVETLDHRSEDA